jgi:hypothetical protein
MLERNSQNQRCKNLENSAEYLTGPPSSETSGGNDEKEFSEGANMKAPRDF